MTGPEHYKEAESFERLARISSDEERLEDVAQELRFAQVHATLALAAELKGLHATLNEALDEINEELYSHRRAATS